MIKAVFFDVDGTLVSHKSKSVPESTRRAIGQLKEKGIKVCMATGRHLLEIEELPVKDIEFDGYVMQNGQLCYNEKKELLFGFPLEPETIEKFVKMFDEKEIPILFVEDDQMYLNFVNDRVRQTQSDISTSVPQIGTYGGGTLYHVCAYVDDVEAVDIAEKMSECKITRWHPKAIELIAGSGGKMAGIKKLIEVYGITQEEVMAFGDGENDMEMLQYAHIGVAMGNAVDEAKAIADYVTSDIDENGIENALKYFEII